VGGCSSIHPFQLRIFRVSGCLGVFGAAGLVRAVFYDVGSTLLFISFGVFFLIIYGGSYQDIIKRSVLFPPLLAVISGITANKLHIPLGSVIPNTLGYLSGAAIPMIMLSLGLSLEFKVLKNILVSHPLFQRLN
jgi:predicted permease